MTLLLSSGMNARQPFHARKGASRERVWVGTRLLDARVAAVRMSVKPPPSQIALDLPENGRPNESADGWGTALDAIIRLDSVVRTDVDGLRVKMP